MSDLLRLPDPVEQYAGLLRIRQKAYLRTLVMVALIALLTLVSVIVYLAILFPALFPVMLSTCLVLSIVLGLVRAYIDDAMATSLLAVLEALQREKGQPARPHPAER
jgi:hypothetical protein